jgi:hypothetical protein
MSSFEIRQIVTIMGLLLCLGGFSLSNAFGNAENLEGRVVSKIIVRC